VESALTRSGVARTGLTTLGARAQLGGIVALSFALRAIGAVAHAAPQVFPDEYLYATLGRSLAAHGDLRIRGAAVHFPALLEPVLAAPLWAIASPVTAYRLIQVENALFMSLAAIPAYLIARRLSLPHRYALLCAAFAVAIPDLVFSGYVLTDPLAYPLVLASLYTGLVALERPTRKTQAAFLGFAALATTARLQYVTLFVAYAVAAVALERRRVLRAHRTVAVVFGLGALAAVAAGPTRVLGYYSAVLNLHVGAAAAKWALTDLFLLALASGAILAPGAVAGFLRPHGREETVFVLLAGALGAGTLLEAGLYASNGADRFQERYLFALLPLVPIAFGLHARRERAGRLTSLLVAATIVAALAAFPLVGWATGNGSMDSPFLSSVASLESRFGAGSGSLIVALAGSAAVALGAIPRLRRGLLAPAIAIALLGAASAGATVRDVSLARTVRALDLPTDPRWVDALGLHAVVAVQTEAAPRARMAQQLFWNDSISRELLLGGAEPTDAFGAPAVTIASDGTLRSAGAIVRSPILFQQYATSVRLANAVQVARATTFVVFRPAGTPRVRLLETGRFWDGWLAWDGDVTVWPDASGRTRGTLSFTLSLPRSSKPVRIRFGKQTVLVRPGARVRVRRQLDGRGPRVLTFHTMSGSLGTDYRMVSVRSTMPIFAPDLKPHHRAADR
jgi:hypothetical protein